MSANSGDEEREHQLAVTQASAIRPRLIITADDFGRDAACTSAIAHNLAAGAITATSIMANASHFEYACQLAYEQGLLGRIGVHVCLDEGPPLSRDMFRFVDTDGQLCVKRSLKPLSAQFAGAVEGEISAQIERVLAAGIRPTHLDSHRHIHTAFPIGRLVVKLARKYGIPYVRPARNLSTRSFLTARTYKWVFNKYISSCVMTANYFGDICDFFRSEMVGGPPVGLIECMVHLDDSPRGVDGKLVLRDDRFQVFLKQFEPVGHGQINL